MTNYKNILFVISLFIFLGCAITKPPPKLTDSQKGAIGIRVKTIAPINFFGPQNTDLVYFIRLDDNEDPYDSNYFIPSNHKDGENIYLLNVEPGRYSAVACYNKNEKTQNTPESEYTTIFSMKIIELTQTTVTAGNMAFMGEYIIDQHVGIPDDAKKADIFIFRKFSSNWLLDALYKDYYYLGTLVEAKRDEQSKKAFLADALNHFEKTAWVKPIQNSMQDTTTTPLISPSIDHLVTEKDIAEIEDDSTIVYESDFSYETHKWFASIKIGYRYPTGKVSTFDDGIDYQETNASEIYEPGLGIGLNIGLVEYPYFYGVGLEGGFLPLTPEGQEIVNQRRPDWNEVNMEYASFEVFGGVYIFTNNFLSSYISTSLGIIGVNFWTSGQEPDNEQYYGAAASFGFQFRPFKKKSVFLVLNGRYQFYVSEPVIPKDIIISIGIGINLII